LVFAAEVKSGFGMEDGILVVGMEDEILVAEIHGFYKVKVVVESVAASVVWIRMGSMIERQLLG
jgi:hypothetical protein